MEKDLNLPIIKVPTPPPPVLSMDEYIEFIEEMNQFFPIKHKEPDNTWDLPVPVPFIIK